MKYIWILEYNGAVSKEGYDTEDKAIEKIKSQGYKRVIGYLFKNENSTEEDYCRIYCIKVK